MNILSLDIGNKKIGIAISESGIIASELTTIANDEKAISFLIDLFNTKNIEKIIVGLPLLRSGDESLQAKMVKGFIVELLDKYQIPVVYEDEILTTKEAERILKQNGAPVSEIIRRTDQLSAKLILEQYLNNNLDNIKE
jgi:putative Holliday junction resolvase